jgi:mandelamide amidase
MSMVSADASCIELLSLLASGQIGAEELARDLLERNRADTGLNAFSMIDHEQVLRDARAADHLRGCGDIVPPLLGLPIAFKDNIAISGHANTAGTPALAHHPVFRDAEIVRRFKQAGAIILGKNTMHELAWGTTSINPFSGTPQNPHDRSRTAGGSSGGAGAAVAAHLTPMAIGTDTGGSIRIPAAMCGVWGFRPSTGKWPVSGIVPISSTRDTPGPLARSARDLKLVHQVVTGEKTDEIRSLRGTRIGVPYRGFWNIAVDQVRHICALAVQKMSDSGIEIVEIDGRELLQLHDACSAMIAIYEGRADLEKYLAEFTPGIGFAGVVEEIASSDVKALLQSVLDGEGPYTEKNYRHALGVDRPKLIDAYRRIFRDYRLDAIAFPVCPIAAFKRSEEYVDLPIAGKIPVFPAMIHNTGPGSNAGLPGVSIPVGKTDAGMPVGLGLDSARGNDAALLAMAVALGNLLASE